MCLGLGTALFLTGSPARAEVDLKAGETKEVSLPLLVDGQQYLLMFAYSYDAKGEESMSSRVLGPEYRSITPGSPEHEKVIDSAKRIMARLLAFMRWKGEQMNSASGTGTGSGLPSGVLGSEGGTGNGEGTASTGTGNGGTFTGTTGGSSSGGSTASEVLPNGEPIVYGGQKIASAHTVKILEKDGDRRRVQVQITAPPSAARSIRHLSQALAVDPGRYLPRPNGTYTSSGNVRMDLQNPPTQSEPDAKGNVTFTQTYWVSP